MNKKKISIANLIKPNADRVFIKKIDRATQSKGGIFLGIDPAKAQLDNVGFIVAIGNDIKDKDATRVGVRVAYNDINEMAMKIEEDDYVIIREKDIDCFFYDKVEE
jgi:co-chaperonin GroES (HSP10)